MLYIQPPPPPPPHSASCNLCMQYMRQYFYEQGHCILLQLVLFPLTFSNLRWLCFSFHQLAQTLYLHSGWLLSATCTGGLVHRSTGAYTACTDCNLHCVVVYIYNTPNYGCTSMPTFILNVFGEVLGIGNLYCRPFYSAGSGPCARPRDFENRLLNDVLANFGHFLPPLILEQTPTALLVDGQRHSF